tara:strand:+ start:1521 stop:2375 length:855 start_codon:yes stop_codon:yes gene_type:complete
MSTEKTIPYLTGFTVKPSFASPNGIMSFTDGTNQIIPNQVQCEAYGYTYDRASGTCSAFRYNTKLNRSFANENNKTYGTGNSTETGTNNTLVMGENNTVKGLSRNNIIVGNQNEISNSVNNAFVYGTLGEATANNSIVLGGNASTDNLAERQSIHLMYGTQTTAGGTVDSYLNNISGNYFTIPDNTAMYFHADVIAVRVGGTSEGSTGDFASYVERGVVINKSGTLSISRERDAIKSSGVVSAWRPTATVDGTNFIIDVRGATDATIEWASNIRFTQIKTGVAL